MIKKRTWLQTSSHTCPVAWPSGLRRWFKAPVSSEAWVRIPPLPSLLSYCHKNTKLRCVYCNVDSHGELVSTRFMRSAATFPICSHKFTITLHRSLFLYEFLSFIGLKSTAGENPS